MTCYARKELQTAKNESTLIALADFLVTQVLPTRRNLPTLCKLARENKAKNPLTGWGGDSSTRMQGCLTSQSPDQNRIHLLGGEADAVLTCITGTPELKREGELFKEAVRGVWRWWGCAWAEGSALGRNTFGDPTREHGQP